MIRFIFDLDGTVSTEETLPVIAAHFHIEEEMGRLTAESEELAARQWSTDPDSPR